MYDSLTITTDSNDLCDLSNFAFDDFREKYQGNISTSMDAICCRGESSCERMSFILSESEYPIVCSGNEACERGESIVSNDDIICSGDFSCSDKTNIMSAEGNIYCLAREACSENEEMQVNDGQSLYCSGDASCDGSNIKSNGDINVYFLGHESGQNAVIHCQEGDKCLIVCGALASCQDGPGDAPLLNCTGQCNVQCDEDSGCPLIISANPTLSPTFQPTVNPTTNPSMEPTTFNPTISPLINVESVSESVSNDQSESEDDMAMFVYIHL